MVCVVAVVVEVGVGVLVGAVAVAVVVAVGVLVGTVAVLVEVGVLVGTVAVAVLVEVGVLVGTVAVAVVVWVGVGAPPETVKKPLVVVELGLPSLNMKLLKVSALVLPGAPTTVKAMLRSVPLPLISAVP